MAETIQTREQFKARKLWGVISKSWEGTKVVNPTDNFTSQVRAVLTLCPLYAYGELTDSSLVRDPQSLSDSRVGNKWNGARAVINGIQEYVDKTEGDFGLTVVFSDKGVITANPTDEDIVSLKKHEQLYRSVLGAELAQMGVASSFSSYSELGVNFPRFLSPHGSIAEDLKDVSQEDGMVETIKRQLGLSNLCYGPDQQRLMMNLCQLWGPAFTASMIASYMAFDTPFLSQLGNMYLSTERKGELHYMTGFNILGAEARMPRALIPV